MNKQRKVLITTTYNEMGIIIDTKAEEVAQPDLTDEDRRLIKILRSYHNGSYAMVLDKLIAMVSAQPTPCDVCQHNPPSSMDGKPCCVCPAEGRADE